MATSTYSAHNKIVIGYPVGVGAAKPKVSSATPGNPYDHEPQRLHKQRRPTVEDSSHTSSSCYHYLKAQAARLFSNFEVNSDGKICDLLYLSLAILCICTLAMFLFWMAVCLKTPGVQVHSASLSKLNTTTTNLSASWLVSLRVINPPFRKPYSVSYSQLQASVIYGGNPWIPKLVLALAPPFHQANDSKSIVRFKFELANEYVGEEVVKNIRDAWARGYVDFGVRLRARTSCTGRFCSLTDLDAYCGPIRFGLSNHNGNGLFMGTFTKNCQ